VGERFEHKLEVGERRSLASHSHYTLTTGYAQHKEKNKADNTNTITVTRQT